MAKAHIVTKDGVKLTIEGTPQEVAALVASLKGGDFSGPANRAANVRKPKAKGKTKATPMNLISDLIDGGFFKKPKQLSAIKLVLDEQGHFFPITTLSPTVLRLVRSRQLRRIKDKKRWLYVQQ